MLKKIICFLSFALHISCYAFVSVEDLSLEEKVGQLLMVQFTGDTVNDDAKRLIHEAHAGSIIYYTWANTLSSPHQVHALSTSLQQEAKCTKHKIPLIIACDQEGGVVQRLSRGFTAFSSNQALALTHDLDLAKRSFRAMAKELQAVGVNMNLAPVVDVNNNEKNPVIGTRSFGLAPGVVTGFGTVCLEAFHDEMLISTLKHYPGHGDTAVDSHVGLPVVNKSMQELMDGELWPFFTLAKKADAVMTAHIVMPAIDEKTCATLSQKALSLLRQKSGFDGVIISDSLVMQGVLNQVSSVDEAAIGALNAGCDILILGGSALNDKGEKLELTADDIVRIHKSLVQAVQEGQIATTRVDEAVARVLVLKEKYLTQKTEAVLADVMQNTHLELAKEVAKRSVKIEQNKPVTLSDKHVCVLAPLVLKEVLQEVLQEILQEINPQLGKTSSLHFYDDPNSVEQEKTSDAIQQADVLLFLSYNAWKNAEQTRFIQAHYRQKPSLLVVTRDPQDGALFEEMRVIGYTYSPTIYSIRYALETIQREDIQREHKKNTILR